MMPDCQPYWRPSSRPKVKPPKPSVKRIVPGKSILPTKDSSYDSLTPIAIIRKAAMVKGTLMPNTQRQEAYLIITPPIGGPPAAAKAVTAPTTLAILDICALPNISIPIGKTIGVIMAPPNP